SGGGNANPAEDSLRLTDINLFWRKINMGAQVGQRSSIAFFIRRLERKDDLRIAYIKSVEKRLMMHERCVINVERDLADQGQNVVAIFIIKNAYIFCDETTKRVQCQPPDVGFDSMFAQFLHHPVAPLTAKSSLGEIIPSAANPKNYAEDHQSKAGHADSTWPARFRTMSRQPNLRWFEDGRHDIP